MSKSASLRNFVSDGQIFRSNYTWSPFCVFLPFVHRRVRCIPRISIASPSRLHRISHTRRIPVATFLWHSRRIPVGVAISKIQFALLVRIVWNNMSPGDYITCNPILFKRLVLRCMGLKRAGPGRPRPKICGHGPRQSWNKMALIFTPCSSATNKRS